MASDNRSITGFSMSGKKPTAMAICEGWIEYRSGRQGSHGNYKPIYMLLQDQVLYIFENDNPSAKTQLGNLTLDQRCSFEVIRGGDKKKGFKFDLRTQQNGRDMRCNRFKTYRHAELELWRGYIIGISKGTVPGNLDLLQPQIDKIVVDVKAFHNPTDDSGIDVSLYHPDTTTIKSGSDSSGSRTLPAGGPTMVHKFYADRSRDQTPPSWFFEKCSREKSVEILSTALDQNLGNTLMRESTQHMNTGSYVISKASRNKSTYAVDFEHFEVIRTAGGYKLHIDNPHDAMRCLDDVMRYFIETSGRNTVPLKTNNLERLGLHLDPYATRIPLTQDAFSEPPPGPPLYANMQDDYDLEPEVQRPRDQPVSGTVTPMSRVIRSDSASRALWRPSTQPVRNLTISGTRPRVPAPSIEELEYRSRVTAELAKLDAKLDAALDLEPVTANTYYNWDKPTRTSVRINAGMPPPPPAPHFPHNYVNEDSEHLDNLPVAPPPPRHPIGRENSTPQPSTQTTPTYNRGGLRHSQSMDVTSSQQQVTSPITSPSSPREDSSASSLQQQLNSVTLRKAQPNRDSSVNSNGPQANRGMKAKSVSDTQLKNFHSSQPSLNNPNQFPSWKTKQSSVTSSTSSGSNVSTPGMTTTKPGPPEVSAKPQSHYVKGVIYSRGEDSVDSSSSGGVDESAPGGVRTLIRQLQTNEQTQQVSKKGKVRKSWAPGMFQRADDTLYEQTTRDDFPTRTTNTKSMYNVTNTGPYSRGAGDVKWDEIYDDTVVEGAIRSEPKKVQFENPVRPTSPPITQPKPSTVRRGSEPAIHMTLGTRSEDQPSGTPRMSSDFKNRLEQLVGGAGLQGPGSSKTLPNRSAPSPLSPGSGRDNMPLPPPPHEDNHDYEELPENHIRPDRVTYANELDDIF